MNKKGYALLFCSMHVPFMFGGWATDARHVAADFLKVLMPEWSTAEHTAYVHDGNIYQQAFWRGRALTRKDVETLKKNLEELRDGAEESDVQKQLEIAAMTLRITLLENTVSYDELGRAFIIDTEGNKKILAENKQKVSKEEEGEEAIDEDAASDTDVRSERMPKSVFYNEENFNERKTKIGSQFVKGIEPISHEDQTEEKLNNFHSDFLKSAYRMKRNSNLLGCYVFMKPYAIACAAGLGFGVYKLLKKLGVHEVIKPDTHDLEPDELDDKRG